MNDRDLELERRLTRLEVQVKALEGVPDQLEIITIKLTKYEAKWGTIVMLVSAIGAMILAFKDDIFRLFK